MKSFRIAKICTDFLGKACNSRQILIGKGRLIPGLFFVVLTLNPGNPTTYIYIYILISSLIITTIRKTGTGDFNKPTNHYWSPFINSPTNCNKGSTSVWLPKRHDCVCRSKIPGTDCISSNSYSANNCRWEFCSQMSWPCWESQELTASYLDVNLASPSYWRNTKPPILTTQRRTPNVIKALRE